MAVPAGAARITVRLNARGETEEVCFFGVAGEPAEVNGAARELRIYDETGRTVVETQRFNARGERVPLAGP